MLAGTSDAASGIQDGTAHQRETYDAATAVVERTEQVE
jgi:hypothetical protein